MKLNTYFLESEKLKFSKKQVSEISDVIEEHATIAGNIFGLKLLNFTVYPTKKVIRETGESGFTESSDFIRLGIDPDRTDKSVKNVVPSTIYHEICHAARQRKLDFSRTLLDAVISEGLATAFEEKMFPRFVAPWGIYSKLEIDKLLKIFDGHRTDRSYNYFEWFQGMGKLPRWLGYKVGAYLIRTIKNPDFAKLTIMPSDKVYSLVNR